MVSQPKPLKTKHSLLFDFEMSKICVAIRLVEDGTRKGGIQFQLSPSIEAFKNAIFTVLCSVTRLYVKTLLWSTVKNLNS